MLYTGKGDQGTSKLLQTPKGVRISKSLAVFEALGTVDELNCYLGLCKVELENHGRKSIMDKTLADHIHEVQENLFIIQTELAGNKDKTITKDKVVRLEEIVDAVEQKLPPITTFLIPGGTELGARLDFARAIVRRAERRVIAAAESGETEISDPTKGYLNRLSSVMYAFVRLINHQHEVEETAPSYE